MWTTAVHRRWSSRRPGTRPRDVPARVSVLFTPHESAGCLCSTSHVAPRFAAMQLPLLKTRGEQFRSISATGWPDIPARKGCVQRGRVLSDIHFCRSGVVASFRRVVLGARQPAVPREDRVPLAYARPRCLGRSLSVAAERGDMLDADRVRARSVRPSQCRGPSRLQWRRREHLGSSVPGRRRSHVRQHLAPRVRERVPSRRLEQRVRVDAGRSQSR